MNNNRDEINYFIYNKIQNYNKKFEEFKKNLDLQDQKIKKQCSKNIKKTLKKNPKKLAQNIVNLSQYNIDTTEETEDNKNEIKKLFKGGMIDDNDDDININIEEISEESDKIINNSYTPITIGIIIFIFLYLFTFFILKVVKAKDYYDILIFKPLLIITNLFN